MKRALLIVAAVAVLAVPAASAQAVSFGPNLDNYTPTNQPYTCALVGAFSGCSLADPGKLDMELFLPDPVVNGNQAGVITAMHVKASQQAQAQFVVVEWSGKPGEGQPFPSGVMAVSEPVTLQPGLNNFNTNLPVDFRLASNGFESWSQPVLTVLTPNARLPIQPGAGTLAMISDNGSPLTQTVADLTAPGHFGNFGSYFTTGTLLMSGDLTNTTGQGGGNNSTNTNTGGGGGGGNGGGGGGNTTPPQQPPAVPPTTPPANPVTVGGGASVVGSTATLPVSCALDTACSGLVQLLSQARAAQAKKLKKPAVYGSGRFTVPAHATGNVKIRLTSAGKKLLRKKKSAKVTATARVGTQATTATVTLTRK